MAETTELTTVIVGNAGVLEIGRVVTALACKRVVVCPSIGDGASPVTIIAGPHLSHAGQAATYRHDVDGWAVAQGMAAVTGWWDETHGWCATVTGYDDGERLVEELRSRGHKARTMAAIERAAERRAERIAAEQAEQERTRPQREADATRRAVETAARERDLLPLYEQARARLRPSRRRPGQRGDDLHQLAYVWRLATQPGYPEDLARGRSMLERLATNGFDNDAEVTA